MRFFVGEQTIPCIQITRCDGGSGIINEVVLNTNTERSGSFKVNILDTFTDSDLRNGTKYMTLKRSDFTLRMNYALVSTNTYIYMYIFNRRPAAFGVDTFCFGNNSTEDGYRTF